MALPAEVLDPAISLVATYFATKIPAEHDDKLRVEYKVRGNTITIYECRPPWRKEVGPDWTRRRICTFEWGPTTRLWTLYARDRNNRRLDYPFIDPVRDLAPLLRELDNDPTCIFWG
jgi:Protein of unknown function (DUF3024)